MYYAFGDEEEVLDAGVRPAPVSDFAGPHEQVQRHTVKQIEEFVPMVQILDIHVPREGASFLIVLEQVIVPLLPEVQVAGRVARVRAPLVAVPVLAVSPAGLRDPTDAALEFEEEEDEGEEEEEEELEMFDKSIDRFEHSSFRPRRLCRHYMAGRCEEGWSCTFAHGEQELHHSTRRGDAPVQQITVELTKKIAVAVGGCANATDLGNIVAGVQIIPQEVHACVLVLSRGDPFHSARVHCRCSSASVQEQIVGVAKFLPKERVQRIAELIVVCQYHGSWGKRRGDTAFACYRGAECGYPSATDQWEIVSAKKKV